MIPGAQISAERRLTLDEVGSAAVYHACKPVQHRRLQPGHLEHRSVGMSAAEVRKTCAIRGRPHAGERGDHDLQRRDRLHQIPNVPVDPVDIRHQLVAS